MNKVDRLIEIVRQLKEEGVMTSAPPTNSLSASSPGKIAGTVESGDTPPVFKNKKNKIYLGIGSRRRWMKPKK
jgi:hypothetical protein